MRLLRAYEKKYLPRVLKALEGEADRFIKEAERVGFDAAFRTFGLVNERLLTVVNQSAYLIILQHCQDFLSQVSGSCLLPR